MFTDVINKQLNRFKKYLIKRKDGFWEFPYVATNPQAMIDGLDALLFIKHDKQKALFALRTPFYNGAMYYHQFDQGLWMTFADISYKANVNYLPITDPNVPSDFYHLSLEIGSRDMGKTRALLNGFTYSKVSWFLFKPGATIDNCYFNGTNQSNCTIFFDQAYLDQVLKSSENYDTSAIDQFFTSNHERIIWPEDEDVGQELTERVCELISNKTDNVHYSDKALKGLIRELFHIFFNRFEQDKIGDHMDSLSESNRKKIVMAESLLMDAVGNEFPGIETLARQTGTSPTALKAQFKLLFGKPVFQYFRERQMSYAKRLIEDGMSIKEAASMANYQSGSKFTAAFRTQFGYLPSEIKPLKTKP